MSTINVKRTQNGPHPLNAGGKMWAKAGETGQMDETEARARIEQGLFDEVAAAPSEPEHASE